MTKLERLKIYEDFFHSIQMQCICMNHERVRDAVNIISDWSYSHRMGNGTFSLSEQKRCVEDQIKKMKEF